MYNYSSYLLSGQLIVASLLDRNIKSRLLLRDPEKATSLFGKQDEETLQVQFLFSQFINFPSFNDIYGVKKKFLPSKFVPSGGCKNLYIKKF